ncbi:hypothetical protein [Phytohabitans kaempferiae]|uniref:Uncharacterized protein n=1 Tax=Phytohabitans kaempferiae TaxID=1620943 RepID=A0ABV6MA63_9ACTN
MTTTLRRLVYIGLAAAAALVLGGRPAEAHAGAVLTIHSDGAGSLWITARWVDGHPVTGPASAIVTATTPTGDRIGPAPLRAAGDGLGTLTYSGQLRPGRWTVTAEMASPAVARCQAEVRVAASATAVTCSPPPTPASAGAAPEAGGGQLPVGAVLLGAAAVAAGALGVVALARSRRSCPAPRPPSRARPRPPGRGPAGGRRGGRASS